jgi:hypothetical protein
MHSHYKHSTEYNKVVTEKRSFSRAYSRKGMMGTIKEMPMRSMATEK